jgi:hypothetical protein
MEFNSNYLAKKLRFIFAAAQQIIINNVSQTNIVLTTVLSQTFVRNVLSNIYLLFTLLNY